MTAFIPFSLPQLPAGNFRAADAIRIRFLLPSGVDALSILLITGALLFIVGLVSHAPIARDSFNALLTLARQGIIAQLPYAHSGEIY